MVDDDPQTRRYVREVLSDAGYAPLVTGDPDGLAGLIRAEKPRLVLLDLMLPGTDGIELMKQVPQLADLPVIFISGYGRDETIARAFESGAVDYIVKPFSPTELVARVQAALRSRAEPEAFVHGELAVDYGLRRVSVAGREVALTATEFDLLWILSVNAGRVMTTEVLLRQVWGRRGSDDTDRVRTVVKKLRAQARRQRGQSDLHLYRARRRLPHGDAGRGVEGPRACGTGQLSHQSLPVSLGVPPQRVGEFGIALAAPDGALYEIDAAAEIGEPRTAGDAVDGGGNRRACQPHM